MTKIVHHASQVNPKGGVAALCSPKPRAINLKRATWTLRPKRVTCPRCRLILDGSKKK